MSEIKKTPSAKGVINIKLNDQKFTAFVSETSQQERHRTRVVVGERKNQKHFSKMIQKIRVMLGR